MTEQGPQQPCRDDGHVEYELSAKAAARARLAMNLLVVLTAAASSLFLVYVLSRVIPRGGAGPAVNVPTSAVAARVGILRGGHSDGGLDFKVELRDVDEAAGYRDRLSDSMRASLAVADNGRLYRLEIANAAAGADLNVRGGALTLKAKDGSTFAAAWLAGVAQADKADATGRMLLAQSGHTFTLAPGHGRTLYVFVRAKDGRLPPAAEELVEGELALDGVADVRLRHTEVNSGQ